MSDVIGKGRKGDKGDSDYTRACNRCNAVMEKSPVDEPYCKNCGCPEFRILPVRGESDG